MRLDKRARDGETEARPTPGVELDESVEDGLAIGLGDSGTLVGDGDVYHVAVTLRVDGHLAAFGGVTSRVIEQIDEDLGHEQVVDVDRREVIVDSH